MTLHFENPAIPRRSWTIIGACTIAAILLGACQEAEVILPGKREDIRSVLSSTESGADASSLVANQTRAISLPKAANNSAWAQGTGSQENRVAHAALGGTLQLVWSTSIGQGDSRKQRITADPVVAGGLIYTLDSGTNVAATNTSGTTVWTRDVRPSRDEAGDATGGGLAVHKGTVYASVGFGELIAMDAATGQVRWTQQLDAIGSGQPAVHGNLVYLMAGDDTGWAVETDTGRVAWQVGGSTSISNILGAPAPVISDELAIFAFGSGELQAVFRRGGLRRWNASVLGKRPGRALSKIDDVTGSPVVSNGVLYAGNQAGRIVAISAASGARIWTANEGVIGPVWPTGDSVFAITDRNELVRLDARDGSKIWGYALPNFAKDRPKRISEVFAHHGPILAGGRIVVSSNDGKLRSFDPRDGSLISIVEVPSGATTAPAVVGGILYVVGRNGQLHAFR